MSEYQMSGNEMSEASEMSEFLVQMENRIPYDFPPEQRAELFRAEAARARQLHAAGMLVRLWRVAGRRANVGIWRAPTTAALHEVLESLPLFPHLDIHVTALGPHPNDPAGWTAAHDGVNEASG